MDFLKKYLFQRIFSKYENKDHLLDFDGFVKAAKEYKQIQSNIEAEELIQSIKKSFTNQK